MPKLFLKCCILLLCIIGSAGCKIGAPVIHRVDSAKLTDADGAMGISLEVQIENPNSFAIHIPKLSFDVKLGDMSLGTAYAKPRLKISARSNQSYPLILKTKATNLPALLLNGGAIFSKRGTSLNLDGFIKGRVFIFCKKIKINQAYPIQLDRPF